MTETPPPESNEQISAPMPAQDPVREFGLRRVRASWLLQVSMAVAFIGYGAIVFQVLWSHEGRSVMPFWMGGSVILLSLASWFFLFWWYPVLERTLKVIGDDRQRQWIPKTLETLAIGCVVVVHALMVVIIVVQAGA